MLFYLSITAVGCILTANWVSASGTSSSTGNLHKDHRLQRRSEVLEDSQQPWISDVDSPTNIEPMSDISDDGNNNIELAGDEGDDLRSWLSGGDGDKNGRMRDNGNRRLMDMIWTPKERYDDYSREPIDPVSEEILNDYTNLLQLLFPATQRAYIEDLAGAAIKRQTKKAKPCYWSLVSCYKKKRDVDDNEKLKKKRNTGYSPSQGHLLEMNAVDSRTQKIHNLGTKLNFIKSRF